MFLCWWMGIKLTIFFKKSFTFEEHVSMVWDCIPSLFLLFYYSNFCGFLSSMNDQQDRGIFHDAWGFITSTAHHFAPTPIIFSIHQTVSLLLLIISLIARDLTTRKLDSKIEVMKSVLLGCTIYVTIEASVRVLSWLAISVLATTQLLRWPTRLKNQLRTFRTVFGPCYAICITGAWWKTHRLSIVLETASISASEKTNQIFLFCAALSSCLASFLFRPDNGQLCRLFVSPKIRMTSSKGFQQTDDQRYKHKFHGWCEFMISDNNSVIKKYIHAALMIFSLCCISYSYLFLQHGPIVLKGIAAMSILLNAICTFLGTDSFQKLTSRFKQLFSP